MNIFTFGSSRSRCRLNDGKCAECNETGSQNVVAGLFHKFLSILIPVVFPVFLRWDGAGCWDDYPVIRTTLSSHRQLCVTHSTERSWCLCCVAVLCADSDGEKHRKQWWRKCDKLAFFFFIYSNTGWMFTCDQNAPEPATNQTKSLDWRQRTHLSIDFLTLYPLIGFSIHANPFKWCIWCYCWSHNGNMAVMEWK